MPRQNGGDEGKKSLHTPGDDTDSGGPGNRGPYPHQEDGGEASEAFSIMFVPARANKRARGISFESATSVSGTGDEGSAATGARERPKKRKVGRPRTTNAIDEIRARKAEREKEQRQEREEWERRLGVEAARGPLEGLRRLDAKDEETRGKKVGVLVDGGNRGFPRSLRPSQTPASTEFEEEVRQRGVYQEGADGVP